MLQDIIQQTTVPSPHKQVEEKQLSVDVYQTENTLVVLAPIAGAKLSDISITITDDVLTIRGQRSNGEANIHPNAYYAQECFWGTFSRSIILPKNLKTDEINASFKNGILKIEIPKSESAKTKIVQITPTIRENIPGL